MKQILTACVVVLLSFGAARAAFAQTDPWLVLVSGSDVITWDGVTLTCTGGSCASFGVTDSVSNGGLNLTLIATSFNGWNVTADSGGSNAPGCSPDCMSQTSLNTNNTGGGSALQAFFGSSGFDHEVALLNIVAPTLNAGGFSNTGYDISSSLGLTSLGYSAGAAPNLAAWTSIGGTLTFPSGNLTPQTSHSGLLAAGSFAATSYLDFTGGNGSQYSVTDTIYAAVPEPASLLLLGGCLLVVGRKLAARLV